MIVDSHVYCFVAPDEPAGHPDAATHLGEVQVFHALHHQPAWRTRDRAPSDARRLLDPTPDDPLRPAADVDFRVDRTHHRLTWTLDGEDHAKQIYPPNLHDAAFGPGSCIGEMDYAGVDVALIHVDRALGLDVAYLADCVRAYPRTALLDGAGRRSRHPRRPGPGHPRPRRGDPRSTACT